MIEIPQFLAHRPQYGGYPVPFVQLWIDGKPDFRAVDPGKILECIENKLCAICGIRLGEFCWFIGGELCKQNHLFNDPAMHEQCAEFSTRACAFLSGRKPEYSTRDYDHAKMKIDEAVVATRPKAMYLMKTRTKKFRGVNHEGNIVIQSGPWSSVMEI